MRYLRKNTAVIVTVGPFYDKTTGVDIENSLTVTNEKITLVADTDDGNAPTIILDNVTGATSGTDNDLNYITNCDAGLMQLELTAANTNRVGRMLLTVTDAANHVPVFHEFMVLDGAVYDSLVLGTDKLAVDTQEISSDATAADNAELMFDGTGYAGGTTKLDVNTATIANGAITAAAIADNAIDAGALAADAITAAKLHSDVTTELQSGLATATAALILATPANKLTTDASGRVEVSGTKNTLDDLADFDPASDTVTVGGLNAAALADFFDTDSTKEYADAVDGSVVKEIADIAGGTIAISATQAASVSTGALAIRTHHTLSQAITSTTTSDLSAATKLWLAIKANRMDADAKAVVFIEATAGLTVLAGAAYTTVAHGTLVVGGVAGAWTVTVGMDEIATGLLKDYAESMLWAECKALVGGSTVAVWDGVCDVGHGLVVAVV